MRENAGSAEGTAPLAGGEGHIAAFDALRVMAMVSVIFMHSAADRLRGAVDVEWALLNVFTSFAFTALPLFLMMSGYLLLSDTKTASVSLLLKKRLPRLVLPLACWSIIAALRILSEMEAPSLWEFCKLLVRSFHEPLAVHFWYMYVIIALYLISPILYAAIHNLSYEGHIYVLVLIGIITLQAAVMALLPERFDALVDFDAVAKLKIYSGHLATFLLGYYLGSLKRRIPDYILLFCGVILWFVIIFGTRILMLTTGEYCTTFQNQSAGFEVMFAACLFLLFRQNIKREVRVLPVVSLSLSVYLMHNILIALLHRAGCYPQTCAGILCMTAVVFIICYVTMKTAASVKPLCYVFSGLPYHTACRTCNWSFSFAKVKNRIRNH